MEKKRILGIALAVVIVVGIAGVLVSGKIGGGTAQTAGQSLTVVHGVIGSEKKPFFDDPGVKQVFADHGLDVQVTTAGSRQIATTVDLTGQDFVFPSSATAAEKIRKVKNAKTTYSPFYSPIAIATFKPIADLLTAAGIASKDAAGVWHFDMAAYLAAVAAGTRWNQLPGAAATYNSSRAMLIASTDVRQSNSAAMYLAISSYVANGNNIVSTPAQQAALLAPMSGLFLNQGYSAASSDSPFEDYLSQGIGSKPMVLVYEAQFLDRQMSSTDVTNDMLLMYPTPTVFSKHTVVPLTSTGDTVGALLQNEPTLAALAAVHGFRPADAQLFAKTLAEHQLPAPASLIDVVDTPSYETLESMITDIGAQYQTVAPPDVTPTSK
jgi:hypothetical protein